MQHLGRLGTGAVLATAMFLGQAAPSHAEADAVRVGMQSGLTYLAFAVMEHDKLIEEAAVAAGMPNLNVSYVHSAGGVMNDSLLSNGIDFAVAGIPSFLTLWAKGSEQFDVRGVASYGATSITLVTRNPDIKTIADFTDKDRIAVPAVGRSLQAILLAMAAEKVFGADGATRLDPLTTTRSHPDAMAALLADTEINSHFTVPPYTQQELSDPRVHVVTTSEEIVGSPVSSGVLYTTVRFYEANPTVVGIVQAALKKAIDTINSDPEHAAEAYLTVWEEKADPQKIVEQIKAPGSIYSMVPQGTLLLAQFMYRTKMIEKQPADWKELFFPPIHSEPGT